MTAVTDRDQLRYIAGQAASVREGIERAGSVVDSGDAEKVLARLVAASQAESVPR